MSRLEELFSKSRKGLESLEDIKDSLITPSTGKVLAENVTPLQAFDKLHRVACRTYVEIKL